MVELWGTSSSIHSVVWWWVCPKLSSFPLVWKQRCVFPDMEVPAQGLSTILDDLMGKAPIATTILSQGPVVRLQPGDYVAVQVVKAHGQTLIAMPLARTSLVEFTSSSLAYQSLYPLVAQQDLGNIVAMAAQ